MEFLTRLVSTNGMNFIGGFARDEGTKGKFIISRCNFSNSHLTDLMIDQTQSKYGDVYFALGAFKFDEEDRKYTRKQRNVTELKAFWLDIDCGEEKYKRAQARGVIDVYRTKELGLLALKKFLSDTKLPSPTFIVSSGEGWHVYWELQTPVPTAQWRYTANALKGVCAHFGLLADRTRTADPASVLRVPGTQHSKSGNYVTIMRDSQKAFTYEDFHQQVAALGVFSANQTVGRTDAFALGPVPSYAVAEGSSMEGVAADFEPKSFEAILLKQKHEGSGCAQLLWAYENQQEVPYALWSAGLSIIKFCQDAEEWAIKFSENHSEFDEGHTLKIMNGFNAPRTCAWYQENNPGLCAGCPHAKACASSPTQSPIKFGGDLERAPTVVTSPVVLPAVPGAPPPPVVTEQFIIPSLPFPFYRDPLKGGVWRSNKAGDGNTDEDGNVEPTMVVEYDFYLHDRIRDEHADMAPKYWARLHTPHDGVLDFELTATDIVSTGQKLVETLATKHIILTGKQINEMSAYLKAMAAKMQRERPMSQAPMQLGWTEQGTFVLGRCEYTKAGVRAAPVSSTVIAKTFDKACHRRTDAEDKLEDWRKMLLGLYGGDDAGVYRLVLAAGFGSVLRSRFALEKGGVLNLFSEDSGVGKTTLTRVISAIYGSPDSFVVQAKHGTTNVAFFETISYLNSLPMVNDEIGQLTAWEMMEFIHTCTSGKSKIRGSAQMNDVRPTLPGWRSFVFSSSNVSIWNRIAEERVENEAFIMRVAEIPIKRIAASSNKVEGDKLVRMLNNLHGVCAPVWIDYIVRHEDQLRGMWEATVQRLTTDAGLHARYRYWADMLASAALGAEVAYELGLFPFDPARVYSGCVALLKYLKAKSSYLVLTDADILAEFFGTNLDKVLVTGSAASSFPVLQPRKTVGIRIEPDTKYIYITVQAVADFAKERGFDRSRLEGVLEYAGGVRTSVDLLRGTTMALAGQQMRAWAIDTTKPQAQSVFNLEKYLEELRRREDAATEDIGNNKSPA
nr:MAG TPA: Replication protein B [Caudoviricetes sp.]